MPATRRINIDVPLIVGAVVLSLYGLAMVFSAGQTDVKTIAAGAYKSQAIWIVVGIVAAYSVSRASVRLIEWLTLPAYALTLVLLLALLLGLGSGAGTASSTAGWLTIAGHRLGQPAEAKAALDEGIVLLDKQVPPPRQYNDAIGGGVENWLVCQILRREAEALLRGTPVR